MPEDEGRPPLQSGYSLPYYTRDGGDTEYLISNPGPAPVTGTLVVFGPNCKPAGRPVRIVVRPHCTQSVRVRPIVPDHAGHSVLAVTKPLVIGILYTRQTGVALVGNANVGADALVPWLRGTRTKTYAFSFRTKPLGTDTLEGALFVSNPNAANLPGLLTLYDETCKSLGGKKFAVKPGCTQELRFPAGHFGYGEVRVGAPAVLNVLHFARSARGLTAAELLGEANRIQEPPPPGAGLLIDYTHGCRGAASGDMTDWEASLTAAGITVAHLTTPPVTAAALQPYKAFAVIMPRTGYYPAETQAISDFVNAGGGLLVGQDYGVDPSVGGPMPWSWPTRSVLGVFGLIDDNNVAEDALHHDSGNVANVIFEAATCFKPHPVVAGLKAVSVSATSTCSAATGWTTVIETDTDAVPASQPVLVEQAVGAGRVLVGGDTNWWSNSELGKYDNKTFGVRCAERVLFKI